MMLKIDSVGADPNNLFTEGAPSQGTPATVVSAKWLNTVQEELVSVVLASGQTLDQTGASVDQLLSAITTIVGAGGDLQEFSIDNDVQTAIALNALTLDSDQIVSAQIGFDIQRRTDTGSVNESGTILCSYNNELATWSLSYESFGGDAGVNFEIDNSGVISYTSSDFTGGTYVGELRVNNIKVISQAA